MKLAMAAIALLLLSCAAPSPVVPLPPPPPTPPSDEVPPPTPVAPAEADLQAACTTLAKLGCKEAFPKKGTCTDSFAKARADGVVIPSDCITHAATIEAVRLCGDVSTMRVRCLPTTP